MPGNPFKKPFRPAVRKPKASTPSRPTSARSRSNTQMPGMKSPKAQSSPGVKAPKVRVTSKATSKRSLPCGPNQGAQQLQTPGKTGSKSKKYM